MNGRAGRGVMGHDAGTVSCCGAGDLEGVCWLPGVKTANAITRTDRKKIIAEAPPLLMFDGDYLIRLEPGRFIFIGSAAVCSGAEQSIPV